MKVEETQPLISHLVELRTRLLRAIVSILVIFVCLVWFSNDIYAWVSAPLVERMPQGASMIATEVASPFIAPIKLTLLVSVFLAVPLVLYQVWGFIAPALYRHERRLILPLLVSSSALFYLGMVFAYYVVFPLIFGFFTKTAPEGVTIATDINSYLDFVMGLFLAFGLAFEIPVAIILLCWSGVTTADDLRKKRPYIVVGVFVLAMLLTPPDVFSQTLLAIPMCLLFELGVFCSRFYVRREVDNQADDEEANPSH